MSHEQQWTIDKSIPIAVIIGLLIQAGCLVYFGGKFSQRQADIERRVTANDVVVTKIIDDGQATRERLSGIEAKLSAQGESLNRIETRLIPARGK